MPTWVKLRNLQKMDHIKMSENVNVRIILKVSSSFRNISPDTSYWLALQLYFSLYPNLFLSCLPLVFAFETFLGKQLENVYILANPHSSHTSDTDVLFSDKICLLYNWCTVPFRRIIFNSWSPDLLDDNFQNFQLRFMSKPSTHIIKKYTYMCSTY